MQNMENLTAVSAERQIRLGEYVVRMTKLAQESH